MRQQTWIVTALFFLVMGAWNGMAQNQKVADSLIKRLNNYKGANDTLGLFWLSKISFNHNNPDSALFYARRLTLETEDSHWLLQAHYNEGSALRMLGDLNGALQAYFKSLDHSQKEGLKKKEGISYMAIGDVYSVSGAHQNSTEYYSKSITIFRELKDSLELASALFNAGDEYLNQDSLVAARAHFSESAQLFDLLQYKIGVAYNLGNMGMVYALQGDDALALTNINEAINILEEQQDYYGISAYLTYMSDIYLNKDDLSTALNYAERSLELASTYGLKDQLSETNLKLAALYEKLENTDKAYQYYKEHIAYRDSVKNMESIQQMADLETKYQVSQKEAEKEAEIAIVNQQKKNQRIIAIVTVLVLGMFAIGLYRRNKFIQKTKRIIEKEKDRSEALLLNILPEETAQELKEKGRVEAKKFDSVTVLFSDFKDFTKSAEKMSPESLVERVDYYFKAFDAITTKYDLEKIKTIGDAYMCAGGLPTASTDHAKQVMLAASEMADFVKNERQDNGNQTNFEIRIGIHTGPVVAGIVGDKKWQYDIWGDTVNIASRMESNSTPGRINLSETTYLELMEEFEFEFRGEIEVKNRGSLKMYYLQV